MLLTELNIAILTHTQALLNALPSVLVNQRQLIRVCLPFYTASRQVVTTLAALPFLEDYGSYTSPRYQVPLEIGMDFDWEEGAFPALKRFELVIPLADAADIMSRLHQPRLDDLTLIFRDFVEHAHIRKLCSSLSTFQRSLTRLHLLIYSEAAGIDPSQPIPFNLLRPLFACTALKVLSINSDMPMTYNDEDITYMASAWSSLEKLALCAAPASDVILVTGQPLRSVGSFTRSFRVLRELSIYLTTLDIDTGPGLVEDPPQSRLSVLDFGTSPIPIDCMRPTYLSKVVYLASFLEPRAEMRWGQAQGRLLRVSAMDAAEYLRRKKFWSSFANEVFSILCSTTGPPRQSLVPWRIRKQRGLLRWVM
ncbi:hypothetical protein FRB97_008782 [Tulasnella sp. 331]|nr:hypothetical protein FRB97_008782 [Tulasnella sp. 331]